VKTRAKASFWRRPAAARHGEQKKFGRLQIVVVKMNKTGLMLLMLTTAYYVRGNDSTKLSGPERGDYLHVWPCVLTFFFKINSSGVLFFLIYKIPSFEINV
jgi:hypothetical protein